MSSYTNQTKKPEEILYTDGAVTPTNSVYPTSVVNTGAVGATGGAGTPTASPTGTSGVLYTDGAAALPTDSYGYAEWLRNNSYQNATDAANKARQEALLNKQNALVGADTAYKQGLATYGANAESLANKGLSGSGYAEYLTGKNYATARAEKAAANATYQGAMNDILYQENSAKLEADRLYMEKMIQLDEKKKTDAQTAYDALMNSAISGIDLGTLQADARWGSLSPDQTAAITSMVNQKALETRINNGETLDSIMASEEWGGLSTSAQGDLQNAYNVKVRGERYMNAERDAKAGKYTADTITTIDGWNEFTQAERDALTDLVDEVATAKSDNQFKNKDEIISNIIAGNYDMYTDEYLNDLVNHDYISESDVEGIKEKITDAVKTRLDSAFGEIDFATSEGLNEYFSQTKKAIESGRITKNEYFSRNFNAVLNVIDSGDISLSDVINDTKKIEKLVSEGVLSEIDKTNLIKYLYAKNFPQKGVKAEKNSNGTIKISTGDYVYATSVKPIEVAYNVASKLDTYIDKRNGTVLDVDDHAYVYLDGTWYDLKIDNTKLYAFRNAISAPVDKPLHYSEAPRSGARLYAETRGVVSPATSAPKEYDLPTKK